MFLLLDVTIGEKISLVLRKLPKGIFGVSAADLTVPQAAYLAGLPQSPIVYSPYTADGQLKNANDLSYGLARQKMSFTISIEAAT